VKNKDNQSPAKYSKEDFGIYPEEIAGLQGSSDDVFLNKLDLTWMKSEFVGNGDYSRTIHKLPVENAKDDGTVTYHYNSAGFRSGEFTANHNEKTHILFAGCSETEGYGANYGEFWSSIIYESMAKDSTSGFFNLGRGGWGWEKVIANSSIYFEQYGIPNYMFIMLPNISRQWRYFENKGRWDYVQRYVNDHKLPAGQETDPSMAKNREANIFDRSAYLTEFIRFIAGWKAYLKYCEALGVKVIWSTWFSNDARNIKNMYNFDNFVYLGSGEDNMIHVSKIAANKKQDGTLSPGDVRRRDGHNGTITHQLWAEMLLSKAAELGWEIV
jgi:hypothetical protein